MIKVLNSSYQNRDVHQIVMFLTLTTYLEFLNSNPDYGLEVRGGAQKIERNKNIVSSIPASKPLSCMETSAQRNYLRTKSSLKDVPW